MKRQQSTPPEVLAYAVVQWTREAGIADFWGRTREEREAQSHELREKFYALPEDTQEKYLSSAWEAYEPWYRLLWRHVNGWLTDKDKQELRELLKDYPTAWTTDELIRQIKENSQ